MGAGFFGKLPAAGDFVVRGLPATVRQPLDAWLTAHMVQLAASAQHWPERGVRVVVQLGDAAWILVIKPSEDAVGRTYPLVACIPQDGADRASADDWADAASRVLQRAIDDGVSADKLQDALAEIAAPQSGATPLAAPLIWWDNSDSGSPAKQLAKLAQISSG